MKSHYYIIIFLIFSTIVFSQNNDLQIQLENENKTLTNNIKITLRSNNGKTFEIFTNDRGNATFTHLEHTIYFVKIESIYIETIDDEITINKSFTTKKYSTESIINNLQEVVVTAKESKGLTSVSIIDEGAMKHLQPSSFTDLLELLPGGKAKDPVFNRANSIKLREAGIRDGSNNYSTTSLGTSFLVDNIPKNVNSNLQFTEGTSLMVNQGNTTGYSDAKRNSVPKGVDMRSIATDQIERVEIIRGIPSVEYGDLTSGVVKIIRKKTPSNLEARFKADAYSKLYYLGKGLGIENKKLNVNFGVDFLDAKPDPRNDYENYKRITASIRAYKTWEQSFSAINWNLNLDYTGSVDNEKTDPDNSYSLTDQYKSSYNDFNISSILDWDFKDSNFLKSINFYSSISQQFDQINQTKLVQVTSATAIPNSITEGEGYGEFLDSKYISHLLVDGKPIDLYLKLIGNFDWNWSNLRVGTEWKYSKNNGKGQVYDPLRPPSPEMFSRNRAYKSIPAIQDFSLFMETNKKFKINKHQFEILAGLRAITSPGLNEKYYLSNKYYFDPRVNFQWKLPDFYINNNPLKVDITAGYGVHTKLPTLSMLYPENYYSDFIQFNYYHDNSAYRRVHLKTYITDITNYNLAAAINKKWEIRTDLEYKGINFSITYFQEKMNSGFRNMSDYRLYSYRKFSAEGVDHNTITEAPSVDNLPYTNQVFLGTITKQDNGSTIDKSGIEFQISTKRFSNVNTRLTLNGAWFRTKYKNSLPIYMRNDKIVINGKPLPYLGLYLNDDGYLNEALNTNLMADTYLPVLDLEFSTSIQIMWYSSSENLKKNGTPIAYVDQTGTQYSYEEADKTDANLKWLNLSYNDNAFKKIKTPFEMSVNFKASKVFYKNFRVSMFVNRLLNYYKEYEFEGQKIGRKSLTSPYFGMELNIKL